MKNLKQPAFIVGLLSILLFIVSVAVKSYGYRGSDYIIITATALAGITWIMSIINVSTRSDMKPFQKRFWLIAVVAAPLIGGMLFFILHQKANRLTT
ncbi:MULTISPECIES: PLDc N-terminal domain-containing protein [Chitinophagaceae]|uniref:PLDc N-terminal domain-containing protein n=1 Tax=Chitinophagaceae TaxID=563835 RepID=UPI000DEFFCA8|nr:MULTISPECIES: PLDc N-terminal domain-containing protein [Chitinophagaceae]RPD48896.1 hypothetical protein DRJ53_09550 [Paracnuella aquatica]